jgi:hypothetical protein
VAPKSLAEASFTVLTALPAKKYLPKANKISREDGKNGKEKIERLIWPLKHTKAHELNNPFLE